MFIPSKTLLSKGATSVISGRSTSPTSGPYVLLWAGWAQQTHGFMILLDCEVQKIPFPPWVSKCILKEGAPCCLLGPGDRGRALMRGCSQQGDSVVLPCPAPWARCCHWHWTQKCWCWREAVTVHSEFTGGGAACWSFPEGKEGLKHCFSQLKDS